MRAEDFERMGLVESLRLIHEEVKELSELVRLACDESKGETDDGRK